MLAGAESWIHPSSNDSKSAGKGGSFAEGETSLVLTSRGRSTASASSAAAGPAQVTHASANAKRTASSELKGVRDRISEGLALEDVSSASRCPVWRGK